MGKYLFTHTHTHPSKIPYINIPIYRSLPNTLHSQHKYRYCLYWRYGLHFGVCVGACMHTYSAWLFNCCCLFVCVCVFVCICIRVCLCVYIRYHGSAEVQGSLVEWLQQLSGSASGRGGGHHWGLTIVRVHSRLGTGRVLLTVLLTALCRAEVLSTGGGGSWRVERERVKDRKNVLVLWCVTPLVMGQKKRHREREREWKREI